MESAKKNADDSEVKKDITKSGFAKGMTPDFRKDEKKESEGSESEEDKKEEVKKEKVKKDKDEKGGDEKGGQGKGTLMDMFKTEGKS